MIPIRNSGESINKYARRVGAAIGGDFERYLNRLIYRHSVSYPHLVREFKIKEKEIGERTPEISVQSQNDAYLEDQEVNKKKQCMEEYQDVATLVEEMEYLICDRDKIL